MLTSIRQFKQSLTSFEKYVLGIFNKMCHVTAGKPDSEEIVFKIVS